MSGSKRQRKKETRPPHSTKTSTSEKESATTGTPNEESTGAGNKRPPVFAKVLLGVFVAATLAGYLSGKIASPSYEDPNKAMGLIRDYAKRSSSVMLPQWQIERSAKGVITGVHLQGGVVQLTCGFSNILHDLTGNAVTDEEYAKEKADYVAALGIRHARAANTKSNKDTPDIVAQAQEEARILGPDLDLLYAAVTELPAIEPLNRAGTPHEGAGFPEVIGVMLGSAEAYSLKYAGGQVSSYFREIEGTSRGERVLRGLQLVGAGISGFAIGFYLGYHDDPNCEKLGKQLNETSLWKVVTPDLQQFYTWRFQRDPSSSTISKIETLGARRVTLRDVWLGLSSAIERKSLGLNRTDFMVSKKVRDDMASNTRARDPVEYLPFWFPVVNLLSDKFSNSYGASNFEHHLMRMQVEQFLWVKNDKGDWLPTDNPDVEIMIEDAYYDTPLFASHKINIPPDEMKKILNGSSLPAKPSDTK
jgi:hypothetical protein